MMIMSQDKARFTIVGRGSTISAFQEGEERYKHFFVSAFFGNDDTETRLGEYNDIESAKLVVQDIYDAIENQSGNYKMPSADKVAKKIDVKKRAAEKRNHHGDCKWIEEGETPLDTIDLSVRTYNCLYRAGYRSAEEIQSLPMDKILEIRNLGRKSIAELVQKGLIFKETLEGAQNA